MSKELKTTKILRVALSYAANGWEVFPLHSMNKFSSRPHGPRYWGCSCGKKDMCENAANHPRTKNGVKNATTDKGQITKWWTQWPEPNIGLRTGMASGVIVLDIDTQHDGQKSLAQLEKDFGSLPTTLEVTTGGNDRHLYFKHPGGIILNKVGIAPGIDLRGDGGYVIAPPSRHRSLNLYYWKTRCQPAEAPSWLLDLISRDGFIPTHGRATPRTTVPIAEGARTSRLTSIAGALRRQGLSEEEIHSHIQTINQEKCRPLLEEEEVRRIAASISNYAPGPSTPNLARSDSSPRRNR